MDQDNSIRIAEGLLILGAFLGPILAVQTQKWIERAKEARQRKLWIFHTLMATRAARTSTEHVQSLNMIDLTFDAEKKKEKPVIDAWDNYLDHLSIPTEKMTEAENTTWASRSEDLFIDLLYCLSMALGYNFTKVHLKRGIYSPRAHGEADFAQRFIRDSLVRVFARQQSIPMDVTSFPYSEAAAKLQEEVNKALLHSLSDKRVVKVCIVDQQGQTSRTK